MAIPLPAATWVRPPARDRLHRSRRALQLVTSLAFIVAPFVDLLRFDLERGALVLFGTAFTLGELYAVYLVLLVFILVVFAGALIWGRIYCGWMCPQTTLSELVSSVERWVCKGRKASAICRLAGPATSLAMGAFVAASLVTYFLAPGERLHPPMVAWVSWGITTALIGGDLHFLGHRFCLGVCPYGILQNIVQDGRTLGVSFDADRRAECTECRLCVRACFMGVDIREKAFDPRCLNCGDCISATRLAKGCPAEPLIGFHYGTEQSSWPAVLRKLGISDARRAIVVGLTVVVSIVMALTLAGRKDLDLTIADLYERATRDPAGVVHNVYRLTVVNRAERPLQLRLQVEGVPGLAIESPPHGVIDVAAGGRVLRDVVMTASADGLEPGAQEIKVRVVAEGVSDVFELPTPFFVPSPR